MAFELRDYQKEAVEAGLSVDNGILCLSTGAGKSLVARGLVERYGPKEKKLILQPNSEILRSNITKAHQAGLNATAFSASYGEKNLHGDAVYATVGSLFGKEKSVEFKKKKYGDYDKFGKLRSESDKKRTDKGYEKKVISVPHEFMNQFKGCRLIQDECHTLNAESGRYRDLINYLSPESTIGLTATPYRSFQNSEGSVSRIQTRTRPKFFKDIVYTKSTSSLMKDGWLLSPRYVQIDTVQDMLVLNSSGSDYTQKSISEYGNENDIDSLIVDTVMSIDSSHSHILVFTPSVESSQRVTARLKEMGISCDEINAKSKKRSDRINSFTLGVTKVMCSVGTLTTGFDFPALDAIVDARPIRSVALHYQKIGRIVRMFEGKNGIVYDLAGNLKRLSDPLQYKLLRNHRGLHELYSQKGRMTSIPISDEPEWMFEMTHGKYKGEHIRMLPDSYIEWYLENKNDGPNTATLDTLYSEKVMRNWENY